MNNIKSFNKIILLSAVCLTLIPQLAVAFIITNASSVTISAQVGPLPPTNSGGGGGGGGGSSSISIPTTVNFSGMAYPLSKVTILVDGVVAVKTTADSHARFSVSINNLKTDTYNFSVFGEDKNGVKSLTFSFPVYVTSGTTVNIGGIFISPTINIDKNEVKRGDNLMVYGQSTPNSNIDIIFHSDKEIMKQTKTNDTGLYQYSMDTSILEYGDHIVKSKTVKDSEVSSMSAEIPFVVGLVSKIEEDKKCSARIGDFDCNIKVDLVDFSIMAYWFKKINPPINIDINKDGKITLVDFSILAFHWTG